jgi:hypothetical protein
MEFDAILRQGEKALIGLNAEALTALYAPEFLLEDTSSGNRISNKAELRAYYDRLFSTPGVSFTDVSFFSMGERAAGQWTWCGTSQSGQKFAIRGASLFKLGENGIREEILFYDPKSADA